MSLAPLEDFVKKYQVGKAHNSKELRITIREAEELSTAIALVLSGTVTLQNKVIELQERMLDTKNEISVSGGSFT